ncbi:MAG: WD40 repeat domain-containing protein [Planctomycetales bacterium]|nr:WD40 repeat domain-containing protein [Planctomycetales bacterium]
MFLLLAAVLVQVDADREASIKTERGGVIDLRWANGGLIGLTPEGGLRRWRAKKEEMSLVSDVEDLERSYVVSANGKFSAANLASDEIGVFEVDSSKRVASVRSSGKVKSVADSGAYVMVAKGKTCQIVKSRDGDVVHEFPVESGNLSGSMFVHGEQGIWLVAGRNHDDPRQDSARGHLMVWNDQWKPRMPSSVEVFRLCAATASGDGQYLALCTRTQESCDLCVWDTKRGAMRFRKQFDRFFHINSLRFSSDGSWLVCGGSYWDDRPTKEESRVHGDVVVLSLKSGETIYKRRLEADGVRCAQVDHDKRWIATCQESGLVRFWKLPVER